MEDKNVKKTKGSAYNQPDHIKPKSKWTKKMTIWTIIIVVIVLGILALIGADQGWFKTKDMIYGKVELDDYSTIEIDESSVEVADSTIENYLNNVVTAETTKEEVTEGTVENGDTINLDYSGVLEGEEEPFEGGTAAGQSLTLGSGTMIDGFESQIEGHEIGETFDINVTFPEDYSEELAGKNAVFTITINSKTVSNVPELTDELIQHYTEENNYEEPITTIEEYKAYWTDRLYNNYMESAILNAMGEKTTVKYYNEADLAALTAYNENYLSYYASMYGVDADTMASMFGYETAAAYADANAKNLLKETMMLDKVAEEQNITYTEEEVDEVLTKYMESEGYEGTLEEFKSDSGDAYNFLIRETEVLEPKVMEYLKQNVVLVESPVEEAEEAVEDAADAAEEAVEDAADAAEEVAEDVADAAEEVAEDAADAVEEAADKAADAVEEVAGEVVDAAEEVAEDAAEAVEDTADKAAEVVEDVAEEAADTAEEAVNAVEEVADEAADAAKDAVDAVEDAVEEAVDGE